MKSKFQAFETETIKRDQISNAPYNPRIMDAGAKKRLRKGIRENGLVSALTWNKRTGNLVGGHQRLEQLDILEKNNDYELTVCVIDVDEREEAKLNVQLNNPSMQGDWDLDKLSMMADDFDLDLDDLGFSKEDAQFLFDGDDRFTDLYETQEARVIKSELQEIKNARSQMNEKLKENGRIDFYTVIVFASPEDREGFHKKIHVPISEQYITENQVMRLLRE